MLRYILGRFGQSLILLLIAVATVFFMPETKGKDLS